MNLSIAKFHKHLDDRKQCQEHPFDLCGVGHKLLIRATMEQEIGHRKEIAESDLPKSTEAK